MEKFKGKIYLVGAFTLAGTSVIAARFVSGHLGTFTITAVSLFFAILALLPLGKGKLSNTIRQLTRRDWAMLLFQALCGIFLFRMFLLLGLMHTSSGEAGILTGTTPAVTALLASLVLKEPVDRNSFFGISSTVVGILLLQGVILPESSFTLTHFIGNILIICAAVCESLFNIVSRINSLRAVATHYPLDPMVQTTLVAGIALFLCLIPSLFEHPILALLALSLKGWLALAWYGLFVTALAFVFWYAGIKRCSAYTAAAFSGLMPFSSLLLSVWILGEEVKWQQWSGGALVIIGMLLIGWVRKDCQDSGRN